MCRLGCSWSRSTGARPPGWASPRLPRCWRARRPPAPRSRSDSARCGLRCVGLCYRRPTLIPPSYHPRTPLVPPSCMLVPPWFHPRAALRPPCTGQSSTYPPIPQHPPSHGTAVAVVSGLTNFSPPPRHPRPALDPSSTLAVALFYRPMSPTPLLLRSPDPLAQDQFTERVCPIRNVSDTFSLVFSLVVSLFPSFPLLSPLLSPFFSPSRCTKPFLPLGDSPTHRGAGGRRRCGCSRMGLGGMSSTWEQTTSSTPRGRRAPARSSRSRARGERISVCAEAFLCLFLFFFLVLVFDKVWFRRFSCGGRGFHVGR